MADDKSQKDSLKYAVTTAALKATATYLWPFTNGRWSRPRIPTLREAFHAAVKGTLNTFRFAGILTGVYIANQIIQPATATFFDSAEDFLTAQNIDPDIAAELSDNQIYIRPHTFWGRAHELGDFPTIAGAIGRYFMPIDETNAMAFRRGMMNPLNGRFFNQCHVTLQGESVTAADTLNMLAGRDTLTAKRTPLENVPLTDEQSRVAVAMHEFAHCHTDNIADITLAEADADLRGLSMASEVYDNPEIFTAIMYARALNTSNSLHNTSLYLDENRGTDTRPDTADNDDLSLSIIFGSGASGPTEDVFDLARIYSNGTFPSFNKVLQARILNSMLEEHGQLLSEDARRRGELFVEAAEYFFPSKTDFIDQPWQDFVITPAAP